jgi:hypothetical protein
METINITRQELFTTKVGRVLQWLEVTMVLVLFGIASNTYSTASYLLR